MATADNGPLRPEMLGCPIFKADHGVRYAYVAGGMTRGISSSEMVIRMARAGLLAYFGTGRLSPDRIVHQIRQIQASLPGDAPYGMNFHASSLADEAGEALIDLFMQHGITRIEATARKTVTQALVRFRLAGLQARPTGTVMIRHRIMAKVSAEPAARAYLSPPPPEMVRALRDAGRISADQARLARQVTMADDICAEADSGGHTDGQVPQILLPDMIRLRDEVAARHPAALQVRVGAAGGIGTPAAVAGAFMLGAQFILLGSVHLCTAEAGISVTAKELLQGMNVQHTAYCPAGDLFESGARVQVLRRGVFFPARANLLETVYRQCDSIDAIEPPLRQVIEQQIFQRSLEQVWRGVLQRLAPGEAQKARRHPRYKMALIFRHYLREGLSLALQGVPERALDFQIPCGPALGAFNQWVRGTPLESWRSRHVDEIAHLLMQGAADLLNRRLHALRRRS